MIVKINGTDGPVDGEIVGETQINGKPFVFVNLGIGAYIKGVYTKFAVVPAHLIIDRGINDVRFRESS